MKYRTPVSTLIKTRSSCRTYTGDRVASPKKAALLQFIEALGTGPFGSKPRFRVIGADPDDPSVLKGLGTYGVIKGASAFIVGAMEAGDRDLEDFGYAMEQIILFATDLELGTCWLGGTFTKSVFSQRMVLVNGETVPAVAALGEAAARRRLFDKTARFAARADKRRWFQNIFFDQNFETPLQPDDAGDYLPPLEMLRLAPSASNKQPWRLIRDPDGRFHLYLQRTRNYYERYKELFGFADLQRIDMGIAMCHFQLTCDECGLAGTWATAAAPAVPLPELTTYVATWVPGNPVLFP